MPVGDGRRDGTIRVLAWPGRGARARNPYTWLLYSQLIELGVRVTEFTPGRALRGGYDVLHVHWPEKAMVGSGLARLAGAVGGRAVLAASRLHGASLVWTTHNARPHEGRDTRLERWYWSALVRRMDGLLHPSAASQAAVESRYPAAARLPQAIVRMGHFRGSYPDRISREEARAGFGVPPGAAVITFLGLLRPYKNVPHLVRTVRALPPERNAVLLVAGRPLEPSLVGEIERAAGGDPRVRLTLRRVPDDDVQRYLRAADLVVLPFTDITNSGSALLALSFDRPVLVPGRGAMGELRALVGGDWVRTYDGELTPAILDQAIAWARAPRGPRPDLSALEWGAIAEQTLAFYRALRRGAGGVAGAGSPKA
ncbi:MAG TPA: glycosyltransferase [Gemmatimonadales bacterium]|jgi:glycosyltransferase involved in cell wall biosynthesis